MTSISSVGHGAEWCSLLIASLGPSAWTGVCKHNCDDASRVCSRKRSFPFILGPSRPLYHRHGLLDPLEDPCLRITVGSNWKKNKRNILVTILTEAEFEFLIITISPNQLGHRAAIRKKPSSTYNGFHAA